MRTVVAWFVVILAGVAVAGADQELELDLDALVPEIDLETPFEPEQLMVASPDEIKLSLWNSPLGRVHYQIAVEMAGLGRGGLVHGGSTVGVGATLYTLGGSGGGLPAYWPSHEQPWRSLSFTDKVKTVAGGAVIAAIIWQILAEAD